MRRLYYHVCISLELVDLTLCGPSTHSQERSQSGTERAIRDCLCVKSVDEWAKATRQLYWKNCPSSDQDAKQRYTFSNIQVLKTFHNDKKRTQRPKTMTKDHNQPVSRAPHAQVRGPRSPTSTPHFVVRTAQWLPCRLSSRASDGPSVAPALKEPKDLALIVRIFGQ